jgi:hypothetical protein
MHDKFSWRRYLGLRICLICWRGLVSAVKTCFDSEQSPHCDSIPSADPFRYTVRWSTVPRGVDFVEFPAKNHTMHNKNDRERNGLRGSVRVCVEITEQEGSSAYTIETTYDDAGRLLTSRGIPETWMKTQTYDERGRLTKVSSVESGELKDEIFYSYDEAGRVTAIERKGNEEFVREGGSIVMPIDAFLENREGFMAPLTGTLKILYNELGQAMELRTFDVQGHLLKKAFRVYDANGRIIEETETHERADLQFPEGIPADERAKMKPEELEFAKRMFERHGEMGKTRRSFTYDAKGQPVQMRWQNMAMITVMSITYNDVGDKTETRVTFERNNDFFTGPDGINKILELKGSKESSDSIPATRCFPFEGRMHLQKCDYSLYDEHGNWTEQKGTLQSGPQISTVVKRRTLSYS